MPGMLTPSGGAMTDPGFGMSGPIDEARDYLDEIERLKRELDSAIERERAADHMRPVYQADALEQGRLRIAAERERDVFMSLAQAIVERDDCPDTIETLIRGAMNAALAQGARDA